MALIVQKYGGTSLGSIERIIGVAHKIQQSYLAGHQLVVVVSAMAGETDRLMELAQQISTIPNPRELDVLLSTGEQVTIALLSLALLERGCPARSYTGSQVKIRTDDLYTKARIVAIEQAKIQTDLDAGLVVVVAGFQGVDEAGNITTLGRGGSDTTAVALAAALKADECQIYTDVDGVYTADPRIVPTARRLPTVTAREMLEMSSNGAKVMQLRAVEFVDTYQVPTRVLSTFQEDNLGTLIIPQEINMRYNSIAGIAVDVEEVRFALRGIPEKPGMLACVLSAMATQQIEVDMITQTRSKQATLDIAFTAHHRDMYRVQQCLQTVSDLQAEWIECDEQVAKLSLIGLGLRSHVEIVSHMLNVLAAVGISVEYISSSEMKISVLIKKDSVACAVNALHEAFQLGEEEVLR